MPKGVRRFRSGDYRYMPTAPRTNSMANLRLLKQLTSTTEPARSPVKWASCAVKDSETVAFLRQSSMTRNQFNNIYLSNQDITLLGLAGLLLAAPLSLAYTGPVWALGQFQLASSAVLSASAISGSGPGALLGLISLTGTTLGLFAKPKETTYATFKKPCGDNTGNFG